MTIFVRSSPFLLVFLSGCDLLFPPCTNYKRKVCACDDAGTAMCKAAESVEKQAKEYKEDGDDDRYDKMQDACEVVLDAGKEADGCEQFSDGSGGSSDDDSQNESTANSVTGSYEMLLGPTVGCSGQSYWLEEWAAQSVTISGQPSSLTFDFGDGIELSGSVDSDMGFQATGAPFVGFSIDGDFVDAQLSVFIDGLFYDQGDGCFVMEGDIAVEVDDDGIDVTNCNMEAPFSAYQFEGENCGMQ